LALQGDFAAHRRALERAAAPEVVRVVEVRTAAALAECDGLIIPGGESTTMLKLLEIESLTGPIQTFAASKPVYGSCAGAILLAREVVHPPQASLGLMDMTVERNAYGRQVDSRIATIATHAEPGEDAGLEAVFIRAPIIRSVGQGITVLATYAGDPVWVEAGCHMATTFHPELGADPRVHRRFLQKL